MCLLNPKKFGKLLGELITNGLNKNATEIIFTIVLTRIILSYYLRSSDKV